MEMVKKILDSQFAINCTNGNGSAYVHNDLSGKTYTIVSATGASSSIIVLHIIMLMVIRFQ